MMLAFIDHSGVAAAFAPNAARTVRKATAIRIENVFIKCSGVKVLV
jgi:hypothetical protein